MFPLTVSRNDDSGEFSNSLIWFCLSSVVCSLSNVVWLNMLFHLPDQQSHNQPQSLIKVVMPCRVDFISRNVNYICISNNHWDGTSILVGDKVVLSWKVSIMVTAPYVARASSDLVLTREYSGFSTIMDQTYFWLIMPTVKYEMHFDNTPQVSFSAHKKGSVGYLWITFPATLSGRSSHIINLTGISFGSTETIYFYDHVWVEMITVNCKVIYSLKCTFFCHYFNLIFLSHFHWRWRHWNHVNNPTRAISIKCFNCIRKHKIDNVPFLRQYQVY